MSEVNNEQHLEALAELARSLSVERELNKLCGPGPAAPPVSRTEAIATRFARDFNGADLAVSAVNYQSIPVMDPRRWPWRGENHFHLPLKGFTRTEYFLRLDAQTAVLVAHRHATRELVLYHLQLGREQPLAEQVLSSGVDADTGNVSRSFKSEDRWVINVQSSIPHSRLCIFLWGNRTGRRALVFSVPGMQRLANVALPTFADFGAYLQSVRTPSDFFYSHQDRSLMRFDIRTARLRRECLLPGRADFYSVSKISASLKIYVYLYTHRANLFISQNYLQITTNSLTRVKCHTMTNSKADVFVHDNLEKISFQVSEDRKQVVVFCEHLLHVFEAAAHDDPDRHRCSLRAVRQMDGRYVAHHRDGHVLALPDRSNPNPNLYVFDMDLNMLWCVDGFFGFSSACFVGENQLVSSDGLVFDWRRRRRYLGQVKYDLAVRINKRWVGVSPFCLL